MSVVMVGRVKILSMVGGRAKSLQPRTRIEVENLNARIYAALK
jgi:hypothetical protein